MLSGRCRVAASGAKPREDSSLRRLVVDFLAHNEQPGRWTFFAATSLVAPRPGRPPTPDLVIDVGGRIAYVEVRRQGGGPLPPGRAAGLAVAHGRGAACFVVRSLPDMECALRRLGIELRPQRLLPEDEASPERESRGGCDGRPS